jgi:4-hydroxy-tetrahydrodipicolinate synthase
LAGMEQRPEAPFGRVATAVITPFTAEGRIDYAAFWRLVRYLADNATETIVVSGTTGESPTLSKPEKMALFAAAVDAAAGKIKVVAGGTNNDTAESMEFAVAAAESGVDGVMAVTPYYSKPPQRGIVAHMHAIADATDLPVMIYNIPGRTATLIEIDTLVEVCRHPNVVAVKDAVDDVDWSRRAIEVLPEGIAVYSGSDNLTRDLVASGAVGVVSVASHMAGREIAAMVDAVIDGDMYKADQLHDLLMPLNNALFSEPNPMPLKGALTAYWDSVGVPRLPLMPAKPETVEAVGAALDAINEYRSL